MIISIKSNLCLFCIVICFCGFQPTKAQYILTKKDSNRIVKKSKKHLRAYVKILNQIGAGISYDSETVAKRYFGERNWSLVFDDVSVGKQFAAKRMTDTIALVQLKEYLVEIPYTYQKGVRFVYKDISLLNIQRDKKNNVKAILRVKHAMVQGYRIFEDTLQGLETIAFQLKVTIDFKDPQGKEIKGIVIIERYDDLIEKNVLKNNQSIGFRFGSSYFNGDVGRRFGALGAHVGVDFTHLWHNRFSLGVGLSYVWLRGDDIFARDELRRRRNLNFQNQLWELAVFGQFDLNYQKAFHYKKARFYIPVGVGAMYHNPTTVLNGQRVQLANYITENRIKKYGRLTGFAFTGIGYKSRRALGTNLDWSVELSLRFPFTEYLDDVKAKSVNISNLLDPVSQQLADRSAGDGTEQGVITYRGSDGNIYRTRLQPDASNRIPRAFAGGIDTYFLLTIRIGFIKDR